MTLQQQIEECIHGYYDGGAKSLFDQCVAEIMKLVEKNGDDRAAEMRERCAAKAYTLAEDIRTDYEGPLRSAVTECKELARDIQSLPLKRDY